MNGVKEALKVKMAEGGIRITEEDPLNTIIDVITLWIKQNNAALIADLKKSAATASNLEKRERLQQAKITMDLIAKVPLELSSDQKKTIREQVYIAMDGVTEKLFPPWWKTPIFLLCSINLIVSMGILIALAFG